MLPAKTPSAAPHTIRFKQLFGQFTCGSHSRNITPKASSLIIQKAAPRLHHRQHNPHKPPSSIETALSRGNIELAFSQASTEPKAWSAIFKYYQRKRDIKGLKAAIAAREVMAGLPRDARAYSSLIACLGSCGKLEEAADIFAKAWLDPENRSLEVANSAIAACAPRGDWATARKILSVLILAGMNPDIITINSLIKCAGRAGLFEEAVDLYKRSLKQGIQPTAITFTSLFSAAAGCQKADAHWLLGLAYDMTNVYGVPFNDHILSALFSAASFCGETLQEDQIEALLAVFTEYRSTTVPNAHVFTSLLTMMTRLGISDRAIDVWTGIEAGGDNESVMVERTPHMYAALFSACTAGESPALVDVALRAYQDMHAWWCKTLITSSQTGNSSNTYNNGYYNNKHILENDVRVAYNSLLHFMSDSGELHAALTVYGDMKRSGPRPDVITCNTLISAAASTGDVKVALSVYTDLCEAGLKPTVSTAGALLNVQAKARDPAAAQAIFNEMTGKTGIIANVQMYTTLIDAYVQERSSRSVAKAFQLLQDMRMEGLSPSAVTYGVLLSACRYVKDVDKAFFLYQQAVDEGILPTDDMHDCLLNVCTVASRLDEAVELVKTLARKHAPLQSPSLNSLTRALTRDGRHIDRALRILSIMQTFGLKATKRTYLTLIRACAVNGRGDTAYTLYQSLTYQISTAHTSGGGGGSPSTASSSLAEESMTGSGVLDGPTGSALIVALVKESQLSTAVELYHTMMAEAWNAVGLPPPPPPAPPAAAAATSNNNGQQSVSHISSLQDTGAPVKKAGPPPASTVTTSSSSSSSNRSSGVLYLPKRAQIPDAFALAALTQAHASLGELRPAMFYYKQLRSQPSALAALSVDCHRMFEELIEGCCRYRKLKNALMVFDDWKAAIDISMVAPISSGTAAAAAAAAADGDDWKDNHTINATTSTSTYTTTTTITTNNNNKNKRRKNNGGSLAAKNISSSINTPSSSLEHPVYPRLSPVTLAFLEACCRSEPEYQWRVFDVVAVMRQQRWRKKEAGLPAPMKESHHFLGRVDG